MATYEITNLTELQAMSAHLADDCVLMNDIDASASATMNAVPGKPGEYYGFAAIGTVANPFTGTFDGGGFTISDLYINRSYSGTAGALGGLFGFIQTGAVAGRFFKDVTLTNIDFRATSSVGGFASYIQGTTGFQLSVSDISVSGTLRIRKDDYDSATAGGFAYYGNEAAITDCTANIDIVDDAASTATAVNISGFIFSINQNVDIDGCYSYGTISHTVTTSEQSAYIAGFLGIKSGASAGCSIIDSYSSVSCVTNGNSFYATYGLYWGGFAGYTAGAVGVTITRCVAYGSYYSSGVLYALIAGGFIGSDIACIFSQCGAYGNVSGDSSGASYFGGFVGVQGGAISECFARGDVAMTGTPNSGSRIGGFTGQMVANITDCYSTGAVCSNNYYSGGFVGQRAAGTNTTNYWDTEASGMSIGVGGGGLQTGVTGATTANMQLEATFTGFDFTNTWFIPSYTQAETPGSNITVWASKTNDYDNFEEGVNDDSSFAYEIPTQNEIRFIAAMESLIIGTAGDEWKLGSNKLDTPITPTNITIKQQSEYGSCQIQPVKINAALLFVDFVNRKLRETAYDAAADKYMSPDLTVLAEHITKTGITSIARQKNPDSIIWCTLTDGTLISFTYEREQNVLAWTKHPLGGDGFCQSVCVLPGATEDVVYLSVYRTNPGSEIAWEGETMEWEGETLTYGGGQNVFIEKIMPRNFDTISDCYFVDCGITATNTGASSTITGLDHLEGETVKLLVDGVEADEDVVENGNVTVSFSGVASTTWTTAHVGLEFTPLLQPMRIILGDSMGSMTRTNELVISLHNTGALKYGSDPDNLFDVNLDDVRWTNTCDIDGLFTGEVVVSMPGGFDVLNPIYISTDKPLPQTVRAIVARIDRTGR